MEKLAVYFSVASMHDLLDKAVLECWRHFVLACRVLLMNTISVSSINKTWSVAVLQRTETLFGKSIITTNMHNALPTFEFLILVGKRCYVMKREDAC